MYKVFEIEGASSIDAILLALTRAKQDGCDVRDVRIGVQTSFETLLILDCQHVTGNVSLLEYTR